MQKKKGFRIKKKSVCLFVAFFLWIVPTYLYNVSWFMAVSNLFGYAALALCVYEMARKPKETSLIFWLIAATIAIQAISTALINSDLLIEFLRRNIKSLAFYYFVDRFVRGQDKERNISALLGYLEFMITVNFFTLILFPRGMYSAGVYTNNYWMGYDNTHIRWQIPALAISLIYSFAFKKKIMPRTWILTIVVLASTLIIGSATATIAIVAFLAGSIYILMGRKNDYQTGIKFFTPLTSLIASIGGTILVVVGTILGDQIKLIGMIAEFFGKDGATLTSRSYIWIGSLAAIAERPIWGYGYETADMTSMRLINRVGFGTSPHNLCLEVLYCGGIVLAMAVVIIYFVLHRRFVDYKSIPLVSVCGLWLLIVALMGLTEPQYSSQLRLAWIITGNIPYICQTTVPSFSYWKKRPRFRLKGKRNG